MNIDHHLSSAAVGAALLALAACSSTPPPREELAASRTSVERASGPVAAEAPYELAAARAKIEQANMAMAKKDYRTARRLAEQADADVSLAMARAQLSRTDQQLTDVQESIRVLREQAASEQQ